MISYNMYGETLASRRVITASMPSVAFRCRSNFAELSEFDGGSMLATISSLSISRKKNSTTAESSLR